MAKDRTQLNINIDPELLLKLKSLAIKSGKTLTQFVTEKLSNDSHVDFDDVLEKRLLKIERTLGISNNSSEEETNRKSELKEIFSNSGAQEYGRVAKSLFEAEIKAKRISTEDGLKQLAPYLQAHKHSDPELVFQILLGTHQLTGLEMTIAYRKGSCAMRTAMSEWCSDPLEPLNEAFLSAVLTHNLAN